MKAEFLGNTTTLSEAMPSAIEMGTLDDAMARRRLFSNLFDIELPPVRIGRFRIEKQLGAGGQGTVWAAYDEELERSVALKFLRRRTTTGSRRLFQEARSLAKINHPNVVAVYDVGEQDGQVWIAMELVVGKTLRECVGGGRDEGPRARLGWWLEAGEGLAALHEAGLVHLDLKPANVLLGADGRVRLIDFGLVCATRSLASRDADRTTPTDGEDTSGLAGSFAGTVAYAAPEQRRGVQGLDARADQYAFCVAVWEALSGARPEQPEQPERPTGLALPSERGLATRPKGMSRRVHSVLQRGLSQAPEDRFPDMRALLDTLAPRRRRWWIPAALVSAGLAGALGFGLRPDPTHIEPCAAVDGGALIYWEGGRRDALRERLELAGAPGVSETIDLWVERWRRAARTSCRDSLIDQVRSPRVHDRRMACLERRLDGLAALVAHLERETPNPGALGPWLEALRAPELCLEASVGEGRSQSPPTAIALEVHSLRQTLVIAEHGDAETVSLSERLDLATWVEARAQALKWAQLEGEAARVRARLHLQRGEARPARLALGRALDLARDSGDPELEADAWTGLVAVARDLDLDLDRAGWALERRASIVENLQRAPRQQARLSAERGILLGLGGELEAGEALLLEADIGFAALGRLAAWERAAGLRDLANLRARRGNTAGSLEAFALARNLELVLRAEPGPGGTPQRLARAGIAALDEGLTQLDAGDFEASLNSLTRARARLVEEQGPRGRGVLRAELALTALADARGDLSAAREHSERARALAPVALGPLDRERADLLSAVGTVAFRERRYADAAEAFERVLAIHAHFETADSVDSALADSNLAEALVALGEHRRAHQLLGPALAVLERKLGATHPDLAYPLKALGAAELGLARPDRAGDALARALTLFELSGHSPELAETLWLSAQAEWGRGAEALASSRALQARAIYLDLGPEWSEPTAELEAWIETHPAPETEPGPRG